MGCQCHIVGRFHIRKSLALPLTNRFTAGAKQSFPQTFIARLLIIHPQQFDVNIDAVQQWTGNSFLIFRHGRWYTSLLAPTRARSPKGCSPYIDNYHRLVLIHRQRLGQIPWEIGVESAHHAHVIRQHLQRDNSQQWADICVRFWQLE